MAKQNHKCPSCMTYSKSAPGKIKVYQGKSGLMGSCKICGHRWTIHRNLRRRDA